MRSPINIPKFRQGTARQARRHGDLIAAVDIGGSKVACAIAALSDVGGAFEADVVGIGRTGLAREASSAEREAALRGAIDAAERMAGETISAVALLVGGRFIASRRVVVDMPLPRGVVTVEDVGDCQLEAGAFHREDRRHLLMTPIRYVLDGEADREPPVGLAGELLSLEAMTVDARRTAVENMSRALERCGVRVDGVLPRPMAAAAATVIEDERELGAMVIDFGARFTEFAVFEGGAMTACGGVALGADHVTRDIAKLFGCPIAASERIKTLHGAMFAGPNDDARIIDFPQIGDPSETARHARSELAGVIAPRIEEIIDLTIVAASRAGAKTSSLRRVVATGGGALMLGMVESLERIVGARARLGRPTGFLGAPEAASAPQFAACLGGLKLIASNAPGLAGARQTRAIATRPPQRLQRVGGAFGIGRWLRDNF